MAAKIFLVLIVKKVWTLAIILLVALAVYVSLGRVMLPRVAQYQSQIQSYLSEKLGAPVSFQQLSGNWQSFEPAVSLAAQPPIALLIAK